MSQVPSSNQSASLPPAGRVAMALALAIHLFAPATSANDPEQLGALWVGESAGVLKISTTTHEALLEIPNPQNVSAVAVDESRQTLWVYAQPDLWAFDFQGLPLVGPVPITPTGSEVHMVVKPDDGSVWLSLDSTLVNVGAGGNVLNTRDIPVVPIALEIYGSWDLWVASSNSVVSFDAVTGLPGPTIDDLGNKPKVRDIDIYGSHLWVVTSSQVRRYSVSGTPSFYRNFSVNNLLFFDQEAPNHAWGVKSNDSFYFVLFPANWNMISQGDPFPGGEAPVALAGAGPDGSAWVASNQSRVAHIFSLDDPVYRTIDPPVEIRDIAVFPRENVPPSLSIDSPTQNQWISTGDPVVDLSYSDSGSGPDPSTLSFSGAGVSWTCDPGPSTATCSPDTTIPDGSGKTVYARIDDYAGNWGNQETRNFNVDTLPPTITITSPADGATTEDTFEPVVVTWGDAGSGVLTGTLAIDVDGQAHSFDCVHGSGTSTCTPLDPLPFATLLLTARVSDLAGNAAPPDSVTITVSAGVDLTPPTLAWTAPAAGVSLPDPTPRLLLHFDDGESGVDPATLSILYLGSELDRDCTVFDGTDARCEPLSAFPAGPVSLSATIFDLAGNSSTVPLDFTVTPTATTVVGTVELDDGTPVAGAQIEVLGAGGGSAVSSGDGTFSVAAVGVTAGLDLELIARSGFGEEALVGGGTLPPDPSGVTDAGTVVLQPMCATRFSDWFQGANKLDDGAWIKTLGTFDDGSGPAIYAAGGVSTAGGVPVDAIARWDGVAWSALDQGLSGLADAFEVWDDGRGAALYVAGDFESTGGSVTVDDIARWDGSQWTALGTSQWSKIYDLEVFDDGTGPALFAAGYHQADGPLPASDVLMRWDGLVWTRIAEADYEIYELTVWNDGTGRKLVAAGDFTSIAGVAASYIATWDGSAWAELGGGTDSGIRALAVSPHPGDSDLYVGGFFDYAGGQQVGNVARWDGAAWTGFGSGVSSTPYKLFVHDDGAGPRLYVGGQFSLLSQWDGSAWVGVDGGVTGHLPSIYAMASFDDTGQGFPKSLYIGGSFEQAGPFLSEGIARWTRDCAPVDTTPPGIEFTSPRPGSATAATQVTFQGYLTETASLTFDGAPVTVQPDLTFSHGPVTLADGLNVFEFVATDNAGNEARAQFQIVRDVTPPELEFLEPESGSTVPVARPTLTLRHADDVAIDASTLAIDAGGAPLAVACQTYVDRSACTPVADLADGSVTLTATVSDTAANPSSVAQVSFTVDTSGGPTTTTVTGTVQLPGGGPAAGAQVAVLGQRGASTSTLADGTFTIPGVNTLASATLSVAARYAETGGTLLGVASGLTPQPGGVTDTGTIELRPLCDSVFDASFTAGVGVDGHYPEEYPSGQDTYLQPKVNALAIWDDGFGPALYVGGLFETAGGVPARNLARWDGTSWSALGDQARGGGTNFSVDALEVFGEGSEEALYVGGLFTEVNGTGRSFIARWDGISWSDVGGGTSYRVWDLEVWDDGSGPALYAGGGFTSAGGVPVNNIARWDGTAWSALGEGLGGSGDNVFALAVYGKGKNKTLHAGGDFISSGSTTLNRVASWDGSSWSDLDTGVHQPPGSPFYYAEVSSLQVWGNSLYVGGFFASAGSDQVPGAIARWNGRSWSELPGIDVGGYLLSGTPMGVQAMAVFDDGSGEALYVQGVVGLEGQGYTYALRWDGSAWSEVGGGLTMGTTWGDLTPGTGWGGLALMVVDLDPADAEPARLLAGGFFKHTGLGRGANYLATWDGVSWEPLTPGSFDVVNDLVVWDDGGGQALYAIQEESIVRWDGSEWLQIPFGPSMGRSDGTLRDAVIFDDGRGPALYVAGSFQTAGPWDVNGVARWDGSSWEPLGTGPGDPGDSSEVYTLGVFDDGSGPALYAGGNLRSTGSPNWDRIAKWTGSTWEPLGTGVDSKWVLAMVVHDDGSGPALYVGGSFTIAGGQPAAGIARWDGTEWSPVGDGIGLNTGVESLAVWDDGTGPALYAGGYFSTDRGQMANGVARWDGVSWSPLGSGLDGWAFSLTVYDDGDGEALWAVGPFTTAGGLPANRMAKWDGASWSEVGSDLDVQLLNFPHDGQAVPVAAFDDGTGPALYVGGAFAHGPNGISAHYGGVSSGGEVEYVDRLTRPADCSTTDTVAPEITFTSPLDGEWVFTSTPQLVLSYSDEGQGVDPSTLAIEADGVPLPADCTSGAFSATCTPLTPLPEGAVLLSATVADVAGNVSAPDQITVNVLLGAPILGFSAPLPSQLFLSATPTAQIDYTANAVPGTLLIWSSPVSVAFSCSTGAVAATCDPLSPLPEGSNTYAATIENSAGDVSVPGQVSFVVDTLPPTVSFTAPSEGSKTNDDTPEIRLAYADSGAGVDTASLDLRANGAPLAADCSFGASEAVCTPQAAMAEAAHTLTATIADLAGRVSPQAQVGFEIVLDFTAPTINVTAPISGSTTTDPQQMFTGDLSEPATLTLDGDPVAVAPDNTFDHGPVTLDEGWNQLLLVATDEVGNASQEIVTVRLDTTAPVLSFLSPLEGAYQDTAVDPIELRWGDSGTGVDSATLVIQADGVPMPADCTFCPTGATCTPNPPLGDPVVTLTATVQDAAGWTSAVATVTFTTQPGLDIVPPEISLVTPRDGLLTTEPEQRFIGGLSEPGTLTLDGAPVTLDANNRFNHGPVTLVEGANSFDLVATDLAGNVTGRTVTVTLDTTVPDPIVTALVTPSAPAGGLVTVTGAAGAVGTVEAGLEVVVRDTLTSGESAVVPAPDGSFVAVVAAQGGSSLSLVARDAAGNESVPGFVTVPGAPAVPPDPSGVAGPVDPTVATDPCEATRFLYMGAGAPQVGVAPGAIDCRRAAVLRGRVVDRAGAPISAVSVSVLGHPELGSTLTRIDGAFDLAVNGGGELVVSFAKDGLLPAQRRVEVPWNDYRRLPDVVMIPADTQVTAVDLTAAVPIQVARGSVVSDADGSRQATLLFAQGTNAALSFGAGARQTVTALAVRATEYTVGANGPETMPAELPPATGYTYAVEFSADEALAAGAASVEFDQPVVSYNENFLDFPAGTTVPVGYYDRTAGAWVGAPNGLVVKILALNAGLADLDVDGSGSPADAAALAALGISDAERQELAALYAVGQSLWRVPVTHFTPYDFNFPVRPTAGAKSPERERPKGGDEDKKKDDCDRQRSIIECTNQVLGEVVAITGTPFALHYRSDRVPGRKVARTLEVPLSGSALPPGLKGIELEIQVGGQQITQSLPAQADQSHTVEWDGLDAYGRTLQGRQPWEVSVGYVYDGVYQTPPDDCDPCFNFPGSGPITGDPAREEITLWQAHQGRFGAWDARSQLGLGGWSLTPHHTYDPFDQTLYLGDGTTRRARGTRVITTAAGDLDSQASGDGGPASEASLGSPTALEVDDDGTIHIVANGNCQVRIVLPDGTIYTEAGIACPSGPNRPQIGPRGDGGPATLANLANPASVKTGPDGLTYILDRGDSRILRIEEDGTLTPVLGPTTLEEGMQDPLIEFFLAAPIEMAFGPDGALYVVDHGFTPMTAEIYRVDLATLDADLFMQGRTLVDASTNELVWDESLGTIPPGFLVFTWSTPWGIDFGPGGDLYFSIEPCNAVWRRWPDGTTSLVAGSYDGVDCRGYSGDGGPADQAKLDEPRGIEVLEDGSVLIADNQNHVVRRVDPLGIISTVAGTGTGGYNGVDRPATATMLLAPYDLEMTPLGRLLISDANNLVRSVEPVFGKVIQAIEIRVASEDGYSMFVFDGQGRHLRTEHARTGETLLTFGYDANGYLTSLTDAFSNTTTIQRDGSGNPTAIVAPLGQQTDLGLDPNGYLDTITNPASETVQFSYTPDGLLESMTDPKQRTYDYTHDPLGRLEKDQDPLLGFINLARTEIAPGGGVESGFTVTESTALGRDTVYTTENLTTGDTRLSVSNPAGLTSTTLIGADGTRTVTAPDGTVATMSEGPDPRFGMQQPLAQTVSVTTPGGLVSSTTASRAVALATAGADPANPANVASVTDSVTVNGRTATTVHDYAANSVTTTTPEGRATTNTLDLFGRVSHNQPPGAAPVQYGYDPQGRVQTMTRGSRTVTYGYNPDGYLEKITDPLTREVSFTYDLAGRVKTQTLADLRQIQFGYDANGNLTSITPPGRPAHGFDHTFVNLPMEYDPPDVGLPTDTTTLEYNLDRQVELVTRPDGQTIDYVYGTTTGRLDSVITPRGTYSYSYHPSTGNLSTVTDPDLGSITYGYDGSLPTSVTWAGEVAGAIGLVYDNDFELTERTVNGAHAVTFGYDDDGLLTLAGALTLSRDPVSGLLSGTTVGSLTDSYSYDPTYGELSSYTAFSGGNPLFEETITLRDGLGRIKEKTENVRGVTATYVYTYDTAGRLTDVEKNGLPQATYGYGANSNRDSWTDDFGSGTATYDDQDRMLTYGSASYTYNANGELATKTVGANTITYEYDVFGNLRQVDLPSGMTIDYVIDAANRRIGRNVNGMATHGWLYRDQLNPVAQLDGQGAVVATFVYGSKPHVPDYMVKDGTTYRLITDHLGSVRLVVRTSDGFVEQQLDYDAFGRVTTDTQQGFQPFGYAGGLYDHETGLVRFGVRDYDAETGRWTSKDPLRFSGGDTNLYGYVLADPIGFNDPSGRILPVLLAAWAVAEVALTVYDLVDAALTVLDPCATDADKAISIGGVLAGAVFPGGGYGAGTKRGLRYADEALGAVKALKAAKIHKHHIFPQQYREFFRRRGIDIDEYTVPLTQGQHLQGVHGTGNALAPGRWNQGWADFIRANPNATAKEIYQHAGSMMDDFNLSGLPISPF